MDELALGKMEIHHQENEYYFSLGAKPEGMTIRNGFAVSRRIMENCALGKMEIRNLENEYYFSLGAEPESMTTRNGFAVMRENEAKFSIDKE